MNLPQAKYYILTGNYGSGKTELSIALALHCQRQTAGRVALVDLDIVNPYFRSAEQQALLEAEGVEVYMPSFAMSTVDIPALPANIQAVFDQDYAHVIIDLGGDDTGAAALGRYYPALAPLRDQTLVFYVINPFRPLSGSVEDIASLFSLIESRARIRPDYLVNNANLQEQTTAQALVDAQAMLTEASALLQVPIGMVSGEDRLLSELPPEMQAIFFPLRPVMMPEWLVDEA